VTTEAVAGALLGRGVSAGVVCAPVLHLVKAAGAEHAAADTDSPERRLARVVSALDAVAADGLAASLLAWAREAGREVARQRGLPETLLDATAYVGDTVQQRRLAAAGYARTRTWLHMTRPVGDADDLPGPRPGVRVRRVAAHDEGMPVATDLQVVHQMLEESFADHFNSYRESFPEFAQRLREDPGHRWDHWWLAELTDDENPEPVGALVGTVSESANGADGSYVSYLGVLEAARGRGVAKGLLRTIIADAAARGRDRVGLEVDADSPTGAAGLYTSMGWKTKYVTESWHRDVPVTLA